MRVPTIAAILSRGWEQALRDEAEVSRKWRREQAAKERESIAAGELQARDAIWQGDVK